MTENSRPSLAELTRQVKQHLDSLQAAGVEWLPYAPLLAGATAPGTAESPQPPISEQAGRAVEVCGEPTTTMHERPAIAERRRALEVLAETVSKCTRCAALVATRTQTVFGVGPLDAELCFIGEAPGADEDQQGEPFVGAAGQLLTRIIAACGMKREEVYICNTIKCRPPGNRTPLPDEAANCREYLEKQLELIRPKFICCLGSTAAQHLLGATQPLGKLRGRFHDYRGIPVLCTYHPAYLLPHRSPQSKRAVWEDMKLLLRRMGRPVPGEEQGK